MSHHAITPSNAPPGLTETEDAERFRRTLRQARDEAYQRLIVAAAATSDPAVRAASAVLAQIEATLAALKPPPRDDDGDAD